MGNKNIALGVIAIFICITNFAQTDNFTSVSVEIDFSKKLQHWDGFGINYVQATHSIDYQNDPQDNGGFYRLSESDRKRIAELIFSNDGLKVNIVKMFLDPLHQTKPGEVYDHKSSTTHMREFVKNGLRMVEKRGDKLSVLTTLFCPPAYMTKQKFIRGRDLDPRYKHSVAEYMIDWVRFLQNEENIQVDYISMHNEGEDWQRWPADGSESYIDKGHDYNMYWSKEQVIDFLIFMRPMLDKAGLNSVGLTTGETTYWSKFYTTGYASAIFENKQALKNVALITSHGFYAPVLEERWFGGPTNLGTQLIQTERPDLHAWSTSLYFKWGISFMKTLHMQIYQAKVNAIIPWAFTKDLNTYDKTAKPFDIFEDGSYKITPVYYIYKQLTTAGQPGTSVVQAFSMDTEILPFAFSGEGTPHPDAIVIGNNHNFRWKVSVGIKGTKSNFFKAYLSNEGKVDKLNPLIKWNKYKFIGRYEKEKDKIIIELPPKSVVTLFGEI